VSSACSQLRAGTCPDCSCPWGTSRWCHVGLLCDRLYQQVGAPTSLRLSSFSLRRGYLVPVLQKDHRTASASTHHPPRLQHLPVSSNSPQLTITTGYSNNKLKDSSSSQRDHKDNPIKHQYHLHNILFIPIKTPSMSSKLNYKSNTRCSKTLCNSNMQH